MILTVSNFPFFFTVHKAFVFINSSSSIRVIIQNYTQVHINIFLTMTHYAHPKHWSFLLNHPVYPSSRTSLPATRTPSCFSLCYICFRQINYRRRPEAGVYRSFFNPFFFTRTFVMTYSKEKLKSKVDKASPSSRPFLRRNECLPNRTLMQVPLKHVYNNLISRGYQTQ